MAKRIAIYLCKKTLNSNKSNFLTLPLFRLPTLSEYHIKLHIICILKNYACILRLFLLLRHNYNFPSYHCFFLFNRNVVIHQSVRH